MEETTFANTDLFYFFSIFFKKVIVEEELDCIDIDDIGNLEDSPRLVFMDEGECGNLIVVNDSGEFSKNITQKKKSDVLQ